MKTTEILDSAKKKLGTAKDSDLARVLGTGTGKLANYRAGLRTPDEQTCFQLADILGIDPAAVIALVKAERETEPSKAAFWRKQTVRYASALGVLAMLNSGSVAAAVEGGYNSIHEFTAICIIRSLQWWKGMRQNLKYRTLELKLWTEGSLFRSLGKAGRFGNIT